MKKDLNRALKAFAAMEALPDGMLAEAENALIAAEGGLPAPRKSPNGFSRFLNSGWGAAVISGVVALGVLIFVIRAGQAPDTYAPPVKPAGSTIEMSDRGADFTISTEQANYDEGVSKITAVMTAKVAGKSISSGGSWRLEKLTANGAEIVPTYHTEEVIVSAKPSRGEYATIHKSINVAEPLTAGSYRLHATEYDGEKYVSVAYCTFTVGVSVTDAVTDLEEPTWGIVTETTGEPSAIETVTLEPGTDETTPPEFDPSVEYPSAADRPYTVTTADSIEYGAKGLGITVKAAEQGVTLHPHRNYRIVKLAGPANGDGAVWIQTAEAVEVMPSEENGGYAVYGDSLTFTNPDQWLPGLYRLYALNWNEEYIDYCDFVIKGNHGWGHEMFLSQTTYTTADTSLKVQILGLQKGSCVSWYEGWSLYAVEGDTRTLVGSCRPIEIAYESLKPAPDEFVLLDMGESISIVTNGRYKTLSAGNYELMFGYGEKAHRMPFTVVEAVQDPLTTDDPDKTVAQGIFFWGGSIPFINLTSWGEVYPVSFRVMNDSISLDDLTTGDTVEIIMGAWVDESFPCQGTLYELRKVSDGEMTDLPAAMVQAMEEMGYIITDTPN